MQIVRELVVHALARGRRHVRRNHQVQVGKEEKDGDGEGGADSGRPVGEARFMGKVDPDETGGYEDVDDREGVGNEAFDEFSCCVVSGRWMRGGLLDQEIISITWWRCQHDDNRYDPVLKQTGSRRVEWPIASPDLGKGQNTFTTQLLDNCTNIVSLDINHPPNTAE